LLFLPSIPSIYDIHIYKTSYQGGLSLMFVRNENIRTFIRLYPLVSVIVIIHIIFWAFLFIETRFSDFVLEKLIGMNAYIRTGEYWRLVTPLFLHLHLGHMIVNSLSLVLFGPALEKMLGRWNFIIAYIWSGIIANVATFFLLPSMYSHLGASGAIFGLFGVYSYLIVLHKHIMDRRHTQIIITILCIGFVMTITTPNVNAIAHFFGFLGGGIIAPFVASRPNPYHH
jgi:rhomboid protease GluP